MTVLAAYFGNITQVVLAALSVLLTIISVNAYRRRPEGRYLLLMLAFSSLCIVSVCTMSVELLATGTSSAMIPFVEIYLIPSVELLMVICFVGAFAWSPNVRRRFLVVLLTAALVIGLAISAAYLSALPNSGNTKSLLPVACVRPAGGFLLVASSLGFNDSVIHGAPVKTWPILDVVKGANVTITVCNVYQQPVGFQVTHYLVNQTEVVAPNQTITVGFTADQSGSFSIYCAIFSAIHVYLQGGEVKVA